MEYIMVPVPEALVGDVMELILRRSVSIHRDHRGAVEKESLGEWDAESMERLFLEANEPARSLLSYMALPRVAGDRIPVSDVARALELSVPDLSGIVGPLNKRSKQVFQKMPPVESIRGGRLPDGRHSPRKLHMTEAVAAMVRRAEQVALKLEPNPLESPRPSDEGSEGTDEG